MKISVISDIHIHPDRQGGLMLLRELCRNKKFIDSDVVIFLGDIFDLMVYEFNDYKEIYEKSFLEISKIAKGGTKVFFVEGNHDFRVRKVLVEGIGRRNFYFFENGVKLNDGNKELCFLHGDTIEINNTLYKLYRSIIKSDLVKNFYENFIGFSNTWFLGNYFLKKSHIRHKEYSNSYYINKIKNKFRSSAINFFKKNSSDYLICGHSHVKDYFSYEGRVYLNNGYAQREKTFIYYDGNEFDFLAI